MSSSFFQKHYWSQHQEWSRNAIIPKVSVRMELKCKQKLFKINYTGNKIHLIVFKSEYKQLQWLSYKHTNIWWLALLNIRRSMRRTENDWMRGISKYVCHVFLVCFSIETTIMFFSSPLFCFWIETTFMFSLLPRFPFPLKPYSSRSATLFSPDSCRKTILDRWHFLKKKKQNNFLNLCFHTMYAFKHIIVNYNQKLSLLLKNVINDQPLKSAIVGVAKFENMNLQIIFWSSNPSALYTCFTLSINLAWMDDKYKDVESKYESRDIWRISKRHLNNIWNPALIQHLHNFTYC